MTLKEVRNKWKKLQVHDISTLELATHKRSHSRFLVDQLVTIQVDFITESFTIQAGQTGIISDIKENDMSNMVDVTFWSMLFGTLALNREELISTSKNQILESSAENFWKKTVTIYKHYLFPLYCEDLSNITN